VKIRITYRELSILAGVAVALIVILMLWVGQLEGSGSLSLLIDTEFHTNFINQLISKASVSLSRGFSGALPN